MKIVKLWLFPAQNSFTSMAQFVQSIYNCDKIQ